MIPARIVLALIAALAVLPAPLRSQEVAPARGERLIRVTGTGEVQVQPDVAILMIAAETYGRTARAAAEANAQKVDAVIRALVAAGVPRTEIRTSGYGVYPEYAEPSPREPAAAQTGPRIVRYRAVNQVEARTRQLAAAGGLIDAALAAGANRVDGVRFELSEPERAQRDAVARAASRARETAAAMATALGVQLGDVVDATTAVYPIQPRMEAMQMRMAPPPPAAAVETPIQPGQQTVTATVSVAFRIVGPAR